MAKTEAKKQRDLCKKKMMVTCILMGLNFTRYAELYGVESKDICATFWRVVESLGYSGTLLEVREYKLRIIYDLGRSDAQDLLNNEHT